MHARTCRCAVRRLLRSVDVAFHLPRWSPYAHCAAHEKTLDDFVLHRYYAPVRVEKHHWVTTTYIFISPPVIMVNRYRARCSHLEHTVTRSYVD